MIEPGFTAIPASTVCLDCGQTLGSTDQLTGLPGEIGDTVESSAEGRLA